MELPNFFKEITKDKNALSIEYANEILSLLELRKYRKKETLLHIGDVANKIFIIKKGVLKASIMDEKGDFHTTIFVAEDDVLSSIISFVNQEPSSIQIDCIESCEVLCLRYDDYKYMNKLYPGLSSAFYKIMLRKYHSMFDEKSRMISRDATMRLINFQQKYPKIANRIPLKEIASYLGIRQQSLSRLRSNMSDYASSSMN